MTLMDFANNLNWDLVLRRNYVAASTPNEPQGFLPIPPITVSVDRFTLLIGASSNSAKPTWRLAAFVSPRLLFSPSSTSEYLAAVQSEKSQAVLRERLNLIQFTDFGLSPYLLEISIPRWYREIDLEIWKYTGSAT